MGIIPISSHERFEKILDNKTLPEREWKLICNEFRLVLREDPWFCNDISFKHSEDTPEVAFAYFALTLGQENQYKE